MKENKTFLKVSLVTPFVNEATPSWGTSASVEE